MHEVGVLGHESLRLAWELSSAQVRTRPWLTISWIAHPKEGWHLVVHDGATGAALHFDEEAGPNFAGKAGVLPLDWDDVTHSGDVGWAAEWGPRDLHADTTPKIAVYELLSAFVTLGAAWSVRSAHLAESDKSPSVEALRAAFPTVDSAVDSYLEMLGIQLREGELAGRIEYWHEPLWLVERTGVLVALLDESGRLHFPATAHTKPLVVEVLHALSEHEGEAARLADAIAEGLGNCDVLTGGSVSDSADSSPQMSSRKLRVYVDFGSIMAQSDWGAIRRARASGLRVEDTKLLWEVARAFADAFGQEWWSTELPGAIAGGVEWTLHLGDMDIGESRADLLYLAGADSFTGYFFAGGRLLIDRLGAMDCDIYVTRGIAARVGDGTSEVIHVGSRDFEDWHAVASHIRERVRQ